MDCVTESPVKTVSKQKKRKDGASPVSTALMASKRSGRTDSVW